MRWECLVEDDCEVTADQSLLTETLLNLADNAVKYGREGGLVRVEAEQSAREVTITVRDDGPDIAPEALPHIFERFYRADSARDRSGTGLGLSIVKWIVEAHHGKIIAESAPGQGTAFRVVLPKSTESAEG